MADSTELTLEAELDETTAEITIAKAVSARHSIARKYVTWVRRRHPEASPAELIRILERHYAASISTTGAVIGAGAIAADVGLTLLAAAADKSAAVTNAGAAAKEAATQTAKEARKMAAKGAALGAAKLGGPKLISFLPAGDAQLQFELTAIFGLAIADIHGLTLDQDQAHALVYGLSNGRVSQQKITTMAIDLAKVSSDNVVGAGRKIAAGREDWSHWATTLAETLPGGEAQNLVRTIQTGQLDTAREKLSGKQQAAIEYGVGALVGGVTRFAFGRNVITAARTAFPAAPAEFPAHLAETEPSRAFAMLKDAAKSTRHWVAETAIAVGDGVATGASAVGSGVATAADTVTRPFRSVDIDGDGIPDEPQALTVVKGVGGVIAGAAETVGETVAGRLKPKK